MESLLIKIMWLLDGTQSDSAIDILQTEAEENCSFFKIESVVSLAERRENNETENPIVSELY